MCLSCGICAFHSYLKVFIFEKLSLETETKYLYYALYALYGGHSEPKNSVYSYYLAQDKQNTQLMAKFLS